MTVRRTQARDRRLAVGRNDSRPARGFPDRHGMPPLDEVGR